MHAVYTYMYNYVHVHVYGDEAISNGHCIHMYMYIIIRGCIQHSSGNLLLLSYMHNTNFPKQFMLVSQKDINFALFSSSLATNIF